MPEYTKELRAEVDAAMAAATEGPWAYRPQEYDDWGYIRAHVNDDGIAAVVAVSRQNGHHDYDEHRRNGTDPYEDNGRAIVASFNAIAPYTAHIDAQAKRIAELERDNARLREGLDKLALELREYSEQWKDEGVASVIASRVARALGNYASDVSTNKYALKDTAQ